jgi:hypothetical protein
MLGKEIEVASSRFVKIERKRRGIVQPSLVNRPECGSCLTARVIEFTLGRKAVQEYFLFDERVKRVIGRPLLTCARNVRVTKMGHGPKPVTH